jgi:hypothetical protein
LQGALRSKSICSFLLRQIKSKKQGKGIDKLIKKGSGQSSKEYITYCAACSKSTFKCSVCFLPIGISNPGQKVMERLRISAAPNKKAENDSEDKGTLMEPIERTQEDDKFATFDQ